VQTIAGGTNWKIIGCFSRATAAIKTDGTLWTWGNNNYGQLGNNSATSSSSPVQVVTGGTWSSISGGVDCTIGIKTDGTLWTWGSNTYGKLGDNQTAVTARSSPVQTVAGGTNWKQAAAGTSTMGAIKTDGTLWMWGEAAGGLLGNNSTAHKSSPVQTVAGGTTWKQLSIGGGYAGAIKTDGTLWVWGYNAYGSLGDNTSADKSSPVQTVLGGTNWKQVAIGGTSAAIKTDGTLWTWGNNGKFSNNIGALGDNQTAVTTRSSPVQTVAGGTNWISVCSSRNSGGIFATRYD
jgi:hypothetical protein